MVGVDKLAREKISATSTMGGDSVGINLSVVCTDSPKSGGGRKRRRRAAGFLVSSESCAQAATTRLCSRPTLTRPQVNPG